MEITKIRMQVQATLPKEQRVGLWQGKNIYTMKVNK